jgi:hypothetical protein
VLTVSIELFEGVEREREKNAKGRRSFKRYLEIHFSNLWDVLLKKK